MKNTKGELSLDLQFPDWDNQVWAMVNAVNNGLEEIQFV